MIKLTPEILGILSVVFAALSYPPYLISMLKGKIKPHVFSWALWSLLTFIAFAIQLASGAGPGAWTTGFSAVCTTIIAVVAIRYGERNITRSDWLAFAGGLLAIPLWLGMKNPTAAAILVTAIDAAGFYPTFRKSWHKPREELLYMNLITMMKHFLSLAALTVFSIPTALFPATLMTLNILLAAMITGRRLALKQRLS